LLAGDRDSVGLTVDGKPVDAQLAVVANNDYTLELFAIGERERLDEGRLHLYLARGWRPSTWDEQAWERLTIDSGRPRLRAAIDGEPTELETPLEFSIQPRALRVLVPPG
jgi:diacylglycerol kinase family enzyme